MCGLISVMESLLKWNIPTFITKSNLDLDMEGTNKNRGFLGKQSIFDPSSTSSCISQDVLLEGSVITYINLLTKITPFHHYLHESREIPIQLQRSGVLMLRRDNRTIKWNTKENRISHTFSHINLLFSHKQTLAKMARNFERSTKKKLCPEPRAHCH